MVRLARDASVAGGYCVAMTDNYLKIDKRYIEEFGLGENSKMNKPLSRYYNGAEVAVLNESMVRMLTENYNAILAQEECVPRIIDASFCVVRHSEDVKRVNVRMLDEVDDADNIIVKFFRKLRSKKKLYSIPALIKINGSYYSVGVLDGRWREVKIEKKDGTIMEYKLKMLN